MGPDRDANAFLDRLQHPRHGDLEPECLYGWWEDQLLTERGYRGERRADPLRQQFRLELTGGGIASLVQDLEGQRQQQSVPQRQVIGIGAGDHYTVYDPGSDRRLDFFIAGTKPKQRESDASFG